MATSGYKSVTVTSWDTLKFSWSESSQSIANNSTTIAWRLELVAGSSGRIQSSVQKNWSVTVNGTKYSGKNSIAVSNNETKTLASGTTTIAHNSDGTKTFSYSFSQQFDITFSGSSIGTKSGSGTGTLDTIARKSSLSVANGTLGKAQELKITEQESTFKHKLKYFCGTAEGYILGSSSSFSTSNSVSWTAPEELAAQNKTGDSVSIKFTLYTYTSGGDLVGNNSYTKTFEITGKPSCSISVSDAANLSSTYGYIKGLSKFKVTVNPTLYQGSAIASYSTSANGATYTTASFTTNVLHQSGSVTITAKVTDKRGKSGTATKTITVLDYTAPIVSKLSVRRCDANGNANDEGDHIKVTYSGAITSLNNKNSAAFVVKHKKTTETSYAGAILSEAYSVTDGTYIFEADTSSSYDVSIEATDNFNTTIKSTNASSGFTIMHFNASGNGMGLGKVSEFAGLDVGFETRFRNKVQFDKPAEARASLKTWGFDNTTHTSYAGIARPDGTTTGWTRVTQTGLLPYEQGGNSSSLGSAGWPFKNGYFKNLYVDGNDIFNGGGWQTATLTSTFVKYDGNDDNIPQYKKIGKLVEVRGAVSPKATIEGSTDAYTIFTLPEGYRPAKQVSILSPGSGMNQWLLTITASGLVRFARYNNGAGYVNATTTTWLPFHAMYFVD